MTRLQHLFLMTCMSGLIVSTVSSNDKRAHAAQTPPATPVHAKTPAFSITNAPGATVTALDPAIAVPALIHN